MENSTTAELISVFEDEQKTVVFSSLSDYLHLGLFTDVSLTCGSGMLRAHKVVLAASSKFFRDAFKHCPSLTSVDLNKELAPHGLSLSFDDVQLIIGILYCVGTVEISSQRVEALLLIAQVMGIPSLITLLKRVKESVIVDSGAYPHNFNQLRRLVPHQATNPALVYFLPPPASVVQINSAGAADNALQTVLASTSDSTGKSLMKSTIINSNNSSSSSTSDLDFQKKVANFDLGEQRLMAASPPSRAGSRATIASLGSFSLQPIPSPTLRETNDPGFDPSFLSSLNVNLQDNQIDELVENALLPHIQASGHQDAAAEEVAPNATSQVKEKEQGPKESGSNSFLSEEHFSNLSDDFQTDSFHSDEPSKIELSKQELSQLRIVNGSNDEGPHEPTPNSWTEHQHFEQYLFAESHQRRLSAESEIKIDLQPEPKSGQSVRLTIPGTSDALTVNFSASVLEKMHDTVKEKRTDTSKSGSKSKLCKEPQSVPLNCQICQKKFSHRRMLERHLAFHIEQNCPCKMCGKVFDKKWMLEQHMALEHPVDSSAQIQCTECDKTFKWHRNLLAHMALCHQREVRYRCRNCPLTFLRKKSYIKHHKSKHAKLPEPWCKYCLDIFENVKQRDDHVCEKVENTGRETICHRHQTPIVFTHQRDLLMHMEQHHKHDDIDLPAVQKTCPVCHKKFLLKKNLVTHMKRMHEAEGAAAKFCCRMCTKSFYYENDRSAHENVHKGKKLFECSVCDKGYSSRKALKDHLKHAHSEDTISHCCQICGKRLSDKYKLKYHMMVHTDKKNFKCSLCQSEFKGRENLQKHVAKFHSGTPTHRQGSAV